MMMVINWYGLLWFVRIILIFLICTRAYGVWECQTEESKYKIYNGLLAEEYKKFGIKNMRMLIIFLIVFIATFFIKTS